MSYIEVECTKCGCMTNAEVYCKPCFNDLDAKIEELEKAKDELLKAI